MNSENMDRLFREGAEKYEAKPSASAWEAIQGQVGTKTSVWPMIWKVAAVLVVIVSSVLVLFNANEQTSFSLAGVVDHPQWTTTVMSWDISENVAFTDQEAATKISVIAYTPVEEVSIEKEKTIKNTGLYIFLTKTKDKHMQKR